MDTGFDIFYGLYTINFCHSFFHMFKLFRIKSVRQIMRSFAKDIPCRLTDD
ncbi:hypothetical protein D3C75_553940 [compost metagenome]